MQKGQNDLQGPKAVQLVQYLMLNWKLHGHNINDRDNVRHICQLKLLLSAVSDSYWGRHEHQVSSEISQGLSCCWKRIWELPFGWDKWEEHAMKP